MGEKEKHLQSNRHFEPPNRPQTAVVSLLPHRSPCPFGDPPTLRPMCSRRRSSEEEEVRAERATQPRPTSHHAHQHPSSRLVAPSRAAHTRPTSLPAVRRNPGDSALADVRAFLAAPPAPRCTIATPVRIWWWPRPATRMLCSSRRALSRAPVGSGSASRRPCPMPCSLGWVEIDQECIPWCTATPTASLRHRAPQLPFDGPLCWIVTAGEL